MKNRETKKDDMKSESRIVRIGGLLREIVTVSDMEGHIIHKMVKPLMIEFRLHDVAQVIVGSALLALPVAFTEEVWNLAETLPGINVIIICLLSVAFIALFVFHQFYRRHFSAHKSEFFQRVLSIYIITLIVVGVFLTLIERAPWSVDHVLALKRMILVALPASLSAAVVDSLK